MKKLQKIANHGDVYQILEEARDNKFIGWRDVKQLHDFRKQVIDIFSLMDVDNDRTLYAENDELDEFWDIMDDMDRIKQIKFSFKKPNIVDGHNEWIARGKEELTIVKFHHIQKYLWEGK